MAHPRADDFESHPVSIDIDIVDEHNKKKENYVLQFENGNGDIQKVGQERQRFADTVAQDDDPVSVGEKWVIVKSDGSRIAMDEDREVFSYKTHLENSYILTMSN